MWELWKGITLNVVTAMPIYYIVLRGKLEITATNKALDSAGYYSMTFPGDTKVFTGASSSDLNVENGTLFSAIANPKSTLVSVKYLRFEGDYSAGGSSSGNSSSKEEAKKESPTQKFTNNAVKTAKASGTVDATGGWKSFDRGTLKELSKADRDITIYFDHDTHVYSVTVPKGFDPEKLLNEEGYCGFQYLVKVYGAKVVGRIAK